MATWADVRAHMRKAYTLAEEGEDWLALDFQFENERLQRITLHAFEALGKHWLSFRSRICRFDQMSPEAALRKTGEFAVGAIGLTGEGSSAAYEMIYTTILDTLDPDELNVPLNVIARTADSIEEEMTSEDIS